MQTTFWTDRRVFVTGGTGFLGGYLVQEILRQGADVVCLVRDEPPRSRFYEAGLAAQATLVHGDIVNQSLLERTLAEYEVDTVFHLAAQTIVNTANREPAGTFDANIRGTWALLEACRRNGAVKAIVVASSDKAYGEQKILPYSEETPLQGMHPYDVSKSCADLIAQTYAHSYWLPVAVTRCGNFYGGGDLNWNRIVPGTIRSVVRGQRPIIRSNGLFIRDYFYVEDGAAAYMLLAQQLLQRPELRGHAFNFSNESQVTVLELVEKILGIMKTDLQPDVRDGASNEIVHQYLSAAKARQMLKWAPLFTLETALARTVDWYRGFLSREQQ